MDEFSRTSFTLDQTDEDILTPTVSDEAIEATVGEVGLAWTGGGMSKVLPGGCC